MLTNDWFESHNVKDLNLKRVYGNITLSLICCVIFGGCILIILGKISAQKSLGLVDWLVFIFSIYIVLKSLLRLFVPYFKYDESGFSKWTFRGEKIYKWDDIENVFYSDFTDNFLFFLKDGTKISIGMNYTREFLETLYDLNFCLRKCSKHPENTEILSKRLSKK